MRVRNLNVPGFRVILLTVLAGILCSVVGVIEAAAGEKLLVEKVPYVYQRERLD